MKSLLARLQKKYAKLPLWAWASAAGGAGWYFLRRKGGTAAEQVAAGGDGLPSSVDAYGPSSDSGDLSGVGPVSNGSNVGAGESFPDAGVTSDFQDFMGQLYAQEEDRRAEATTPVPTQSAEAVDPTSTATAKIPPKPAGKASKKPRGRPRWIPARRGEKGHWAYANGTWAKPPAGAAAGGPKPKPAPRPSAKPIRTRVATAIGKGRAGARPRPAKPKPAPPKARPRGIAKKTTAAKPKPKPKPKPKAFALPGMKPIGGRRR